MPYSREGGKLKPRKYTKSDVMSKLQEEKVKFVDLQFTDVPGRLQHVTVPTESLDDDAFDDGVPKLDGSSIRGFTDIYDSDMLLIPDPMTYGTLPWSPDPLKTGRMICDVARGFGMGRFSRDPGTLLNEQKKKRRSRDSTQPIGVLKLSSSSLTKSLGMSRLHSRVRDTILSQGRQLGTTELAPATARQFDSRKDTSLHLRRILYRISGVNV